MSAFKISKTNPLKEDKLLFLVSITPNIYHKNYIINKNYEHAINLTNETLKNISNNRNIIFINNDQILNNNDYFIDSCCHLSEKGALKIAKEIISFL